MNNWPYTNMHELNLDWIISEIKHIEETYGDIDTAADAAIARIQEQENLSVEELNTTKATILSALTAAQNLAIAAIDADKASALSDIEDKAEEAVNLSIDAINQAGTYWNQHVNSLLADMPADLASLTQTMAIIGNILTGDADQDITWFVGDYVGGSKEEFASFSDASTNLIIGGAGLRFTIKLEAAAGADTKLYQIVWFTGKGETEGTYIGQHEVSMGLATQYTWTVPDSCYAFSVTVRNSQTNFTSDPVDIATMKWRTDYSDLTDQVEEIEKSIAPVIFNGNQNTTGSTVAAGSWVWAQLSPVDPYKLYRVTEDVLDDGHVGSSNTVLIDVENEIDTVKSAITEIVEGFIEIGDNGFAPILCKEHDGFLRSDGTYNVATASKERYTDRIKITEEHEYKISLTYTQSRDMWIAVCTYSSDSDAGFIERIALKNAAATNFELNIRFQNPVKYVAFTYRSYGESKLNIGEQIQVTEDMIKDAAVSIQKLSSNVIGQSNNLFDENTMEWEQASYSANGTFTPGDSEKMAAVRKIPVTGGQAYTVSWGDHENTNAGAYMYVLQFPSGSGAALVSTRINYNANYATVYLRDNTAQIGLQVFCDASTDWTKLVPNWTQIINMPHPEKQVNYAILNKNLIDINYIEDRMNLNKSVIPLSSTVRSIAHRGDDKYAPQNTAPSYILARKHGYTIMENDLDVSEDGELIMWHDNTLSRLGNLVDINGYLMYTDGELYYYVNPVDNAVYTWDGAEYVESAASLASLTRCAGANYGCNSNHADVIGLPLSILKRIDFGVYKGGQFYGTQILTFEEWTMLCKQLGTEMYIDKKLTYTTELLTAAANIVKKYGMGEFASWIGLSGEQIGFLREIIPGARCGILQHPTAETVVSYAPLNTGRGFFFNGDASNGMTSTAIQLGLNAGFQVEVWYVEYGNATKAQILSNIRTAISYGVTGITTDHYRAEEAYNTMMEQYDYPDKVL